MQHVKMFLTDWCPYCRRAKALLAERGVGQIDEIDLDDQPEQRETMIRLTGRRSVPQIFIGNTHVGGCDDLVELDRRGRLIPLLEGASG